jgi:hypothetical protein
LTIPVIDDADVDAWYARTRDDRKIALRDFPIARSASRQMPLAELQTQLETYAATAFDGFRRLTFAQATAVTSEATLAQRLKRFEQYGASLVELRDDDLEAQQSIQRDTTLWIDMTDSAFVAKLQRRLADAHAKPSHDPLRIHSLTRVLHYPAYVLGQLEYYRAQYDPAAHPESANAPDLLPTALILSGPVRSAYEQILLARALGLVTMHDGKLHHSHDDIVLGDSHLAAARRLASADAAALRQELENEIAPRLHIPNDVRRDLHVLMTTAAPLSTLDQDVIGALIKRYAAM